METSTQKLKTPLHALEESLTHEIFLSGNKHVQKALSKVLEKVKANREGEMKHFLKAYADGLSDAPDILEDTSITPEDIENAKFPEVWFGDTYHRPEIDDTRKAEAVTK